MSELFVVVGLHAKTGKEHALRESLRRLVAPSRREEGNLRYDLLEDVGEPGRFVFVEHWSSTEAQQKHHLESPHIRRFHQEGEVDVAGRDFAHFLRPVSG